MIYRTSHQTNFSVRSNALLQDNTLSDQAYRLLNHLLSLPPDWSVYPKQLMKYFGWSKDRTYRALKELRERGYAVLIRCRRSSIWKIYETPLVGGNDTQPHTEIVDEPSNVDASKIPSIKSSYLDDTLQSNKISLTKKKNNNNAQLVPKPMEPLKPIVVASIEEITHTTPIVNHEIQQTNLAPLTVEVSQPKGAVLSECNSAVSGSGVIPDPVIVAEVEKLPVTQTIKPTLIKTLAALTMVEAKSVLAILSRAIVLGKVQNPCGYAVQLVRACKDGTLTPVTANHQPTIAERIAKEKRQREEDSKRGAMSNAEWAIWFEKRTGVKPQI